MESEKNTHYHRRFIILTRNKFLIFKEKNEDLDRCPTGKKCKVYQYNQDNFLELELKREGKQEDKQIKL